MPTKDAGRRHIVAVAVTDAMPTFELAVPCEVFGVDRSDIVEPWYDLRLCAAEPGPLRNSAGMRIHAPHGLEDLVEADTVLVPALARGVQVNPPAPLTEAVRAAHERGRRIVSLCTGAYVLAAAGLLDGRTVTTHWMNADDFAHRFPAAHVDTGVLYTDDGDVLTSAGTAAAIDACLHVVRRDFGASVAHEIARRMVAPPPREATQTQVSRLLVQADESDGITPLLDWVREHLDQPLTVAEFARIARMSERTLARRFHEIMGVTPMQWLLRQRIRLAQELLETSDAAIEEVSRRTGFGTAATFRHQFKRVTGQSPLTYRHVFRTHAARRDLTGH
ncbi:helix-turn-helix domain-containing protein [Actinomadura rubrisoli]|uniref:Helix-turn-helix domain-containing protein n=1 Tax=Actinomadura rubrisoli TaxID=2530368 RepID=A0A4R5BEI4_9ACTN|nr:helix-turn-helix domain-containing protein [Actinomadura rubrisoli]TDD82204.1 helix-turn-helix domain-containing protein [Actinomadura rubrisoli]